MNLGKYTDQLKRLPTSGKQIIGQRSGENIIVYQAFNDHIAEYAVKNQQFGGGHYSFSRMSWIKPGFLWMMYRAGWASKEHQQKVLAITMPLEHFKTILKEATMSSYDAGIYPTQEDWKSELEKTEVRLQWDPDHDPNGDKQERKDIQLGMKGTILKQFCTEWIVKIEDITGFAHSEYEKVKKQRLEELQVPYEEVITIHEEAINKRLGI